MDGSSRYEKQNTNKQVAKPADNSKEKKEEHHNNQSKQTDNHKSNYNASMGGRNHQIEAVEEDVDEEEYDDENDEEGAHERRKLKELGDDEIQEEDEEYDEDDQEQSEQMSIKKKRRRKRGTRGSRTVSMSKDSGSLARLSSSRRSGETGEDQRSSDGSERLDIVEEEVNLGSDRSQRVKRWRPKKDSLTVQELRTVYTRPVLKLEKTSEKISLTDYNFLNMLGQGGFGQVWLVRHKKENPHKNLALKKIMISMNGTLMTEQKRLRVMRETQIMEQLQHENIIKLYAHYIDQENTIIYEDLPPAAPTATVMSNHPFAMPQGTQAQGGMFGQMQQSMGMSSMKPLGGGLRGLQGPTHFGGGSIFGGIGMGATQLGGGAMGQTNMHQNLGQTNQQLGQTNMHQNLGMTNQQNFGQTKGQNAMMGTQMKGMPNNQVHVQNLDQTKNNLGMSQMKQPALGNLGATKLDQTKSKPVIGGLSKAAEQKGNLGMSLMMKTKIGLANQGKQPPVQATNQPRQSEVIPATQMQKGNLFTRMSINQPPLISKLIQPLQQVQPPPPPVVIKPKIKEIIERWYLCIVMEHAQRGDLLTVIERHKDKQTMFDEATIWSLCSQVAHGLEYLHSQHVVHRDIKPQNILITHHNVFKIGDLGISRKLNSQTQTLLESKIGTPLYACPELIRKQPYDYKIDMWALGCVLHYVACLEHPFLQDVATKGNKVNRQSIEYQILHSTPKPLPDPYSNRLRIVIQRLLEKDPIRRLSSLELIKLLPGSEEPDHMLQVKENYKFPQGKKYPELMSNKSSMADLHSKPLNNKLSKLVEEKKENLRKSETLDILSKINAAEELQLVPEMTSLQLPIMDETLNPITVNQEALESQLLDFTNDSVEALVQQQNEDLATPRINHQASIVISEQVAVENRFPPKDKESSKSKSNNVNLPDNRGSLIHYFQREEMADKRQSSPLHVKDHQLHLTNLNQPPRTAEKPPLLQQPPQQSNQTGKQSDKQSVMIIEDSKPATANSLESQKGGRQFSLDSQPMSNIVNEPLTKGEVRQKTSLEPSNGVRKILERRIQSDNQLENLGNQVCKKVVKIVTTQEYSSDKRESTENNKNEIPYHQRMQSEQLQSMRNFQSQHAKTTIETKNAKDQGMKAAEFPKPPKNHSTKNLLPPMVDQRAQTVGQLHSLPFSQLKDYFRIMTEQRGTQLSRLGLGVSKLAGTQSPPVLLNTSLSAYEKLGNGANLREKLLSHQSAQGMTLSTKRLAPLDVKIEQSPPERTLALINKQHAYLMKNATPQRMNLSRQMKLSPVTSLLGSKYIDQSSFNASLSKPTMMSIHDEQFPDPFVLNHTQNLKAPVQEENLEESTIVEHQALVKAMKFRKPNHEAYSSPGKPSIKSLNNQANPFSSSVKPFTLVEPISRVEDQSVDLANSNKYDQSANTSSAPDTRVETADPMVQQTHMQSELFTNTTKYFLATRLSKSKMNSSNTSSLECIQNNQRDSSHNLYFAMTSDAFINNKQISVFNDPRIGRFSDEKDCKPFFHQRRSSSSRQDSIGSSPKQHNNKLIYIHSALSATTTGGDAWLHNASPPKMKPTENKKLGNLLDKKQKKQGAKFTVKDLQ